MAHLKNDDKIVDIFVDKMFASRWDEGKGLRRRPTSPLASVLAVLKDRENRDRNEPVRAEGDARMHIAVVMRLVPDTSEELEMDESGSDIVREWIGLKVNEFDDL